MKTKKEESPDSGFSGILPVVTIDKLADLSGYTTKALRCKIERGEFIESVHFYKAPDGRIHFDVKEYLKWLQKGYQLA